MSEVWTIQKTLNWSKDYLQRANISRPRLHAELLLVHATGLSRMELYTHYDLPLSFDQRNSMRDALVRHAQGEPIQYIQGFAPFRHLDIKVNKSVLIPRPETEVLVDKTLEVIDALRSQKENLAIVDCCCGSGCIALSLAYERKNLDLYATDISSEALNVAQKNIEAYGFSDSIALSQGDLLDTCDSESFDIVVSNPPYIPTEIIASLDTSVKDFEPILALDGGESGLELFVRLVQQAYEVLKSGGVFLCELHETTLDEAARYAREAGFITVEVFPDLTNRPRILVAYK
ncbi:MAG: peptide chain release factor N(5)-glutamine methyltransferase [Eggerthellaceae bacterium]|nr:peptide chain release factor N(5)-glutamine methyltransferase [Eggerthellaceae bacterium]